MFTIHFGVPLFAGNTHVGTVKKNGENGDVLLLFIAEVRKISSAKAILGASHVLRLYKMCVLTLKSWCLETWWKVSWYMKGIDIADIYKYPLNIIIHTIWEVGFHRSQWRILPLLMVKGERWKVYCPEVLYMANRHWENARFCASMYFMLKIEWAQGYQRGFSAKPQFWRRTVTPQGSSSKLFWNRNLDFPVTSSW